MNVIFPNYTISAAPIIFVPLEEVLKFKIEPANIDPATLTKIDPAALALINNFVYLSVVGCISYTGDDENKIYQTGVNLRLANDKGNGFVITSARIIVVPGQYNFPNLYLVQDFHGGFAN